MEKKKRKNVRTRRALQHRLSILAVSGVMLVLAITLFVASSSLNEKKERQLSQEAEYRREIEAEEARAEEIETLEGVVGTDSYIEDIARDKLGLVYENEILFEAEP